MINRRIREVLTDPRVGCPAHQFMAPEGAPYPHTVYNFVYDRPDQHEEGEETVQISEVQVDIYHGGNYNDLLNTIKAVAKEKGFHIGIGWGRYDQAIKMPYYTLRLLKEIENGY